VGTNALIISAWETAFLIIGRSRHFYATIISLYSRGHCRELMEQGNFLSDVITLAEWHNQRGELDKVGETRLSWRPRAKIPPVQANIKAYASISPANVRFCGQLIQIGNNIANYGVYAGRA